MTPHPRARQLRWTYVLLALLFALLAVGVGFLSGHSSTSVAGIALFSVSFSIGALINESAGLATSTRPAASRRKVLRTTLLIGVADTVATIAWWGAAGALPVAVGVVASAVGVACVAADLSELLR